MEFDPSVAKGLPWLLPSLAGKSEKFTFPAMLVGRLFEKDTSGGMFMKRFIIQDWEKSLDETRKKDRRPQAMPERKNPSWFGEKLRSFGKSLRQAYVDWEYWLVGTGETLRMHEAMGIRRRDGGREILLPTKLRKRLEAEQRVQSKAKSMVAQVDPLSRSVNVSTPPVLKGVARRTPRFVEPAPYHAAEGTIEGTPSPRREIAERNDTSSGDSRNREEVRSNKSLRVSTSYSVESGAGSVLNRVESTENPVILTADTGIYAKPTNLILPSKGNAQEIPSRGSLRASTSHSTESAVGSVLSRLGNSEEPVIVETATGVSYEKVPGRGSSR